MKQGPQRIASLLIALVFAASLHAENNERRLRWEDLPKSLIGHTVKVVQLDNRKVTGKLASIELDDLILEIGMKSQTILRVNTLRIETARKLHRSRGRVIGTAIGAGVGILATVVALRYTNNENGANSDKIAGASIGLAVGAALLGYLAGRESDGDRTSYFVVK